MTKKLSECKKCQHKTYDSSICAKCGGGEFTKLADMVVDERHVDLTISDKVFSDFKAKAEAVTKSDWSSTSSF